MAKKNHTKKALISSLLALFICFTMLIGTTFAWFTDSAVSANNVIQSGNLDVVLQYKTNWSDDWTDVDKDTKLFKKDALYEPGYTEVVFLRVSNAGNLALKYNLGVNIVKETPSINVNNQEFKLSDYLEIGSYVQDEFSSGANYANLLMPSMFGSREAALDNATFVGFDELDKFFSAEGEKVLLPGQETSQVAALVLTMPETVGNEANHKTGEDAPEIQLGVTLQATQHTEEKDSFGSDYDKDADFATVVANNDELAKAIKDGKTNLLLMPGEYTADLYSIEARDSLTINGSGADKTKLEFANLQVRASQFKNLTINNCTIERMPDKSWGHLVFGSSTTAGGVYTISNCVFNGVVSQGIYINQNVQATFNIKNCTFNGDFSGEGAITIQNNDNVDFTVNVTGCEFKNIPTTSHEICVLYEYDGFTLNVQDGVKPFWKAKNP